MAFFKYGSKNGISTVIYLARKVCDIYLASSESLISYIDGSSLDSDQKLVVKNWMSTAVTVCTLLKTAVYIASE